MDYYLPSKIHKNSYTVSYNKEKVSLPLYQLCGSVTEYKQQYLYLLSPVSDNNLELAVSSDY